MSIPRPASATGTGYTYYDILSLSAHGDETSLSKDEIKTAYRRALLVHHPDKVPHHHGLNCSTDTAQIAIDPKYTVDEIVTAYQVLLDPAKRAAYDHKLETLANRTDSNGQNGTHIGVEEYDLEDMTFEESSNVWSKSCRCGNELGYVLNEQDLERESHSGELYIGCRGCSLFIKVLFAVEEQA